MRKANNRIYYIYLLLIGIVLFNLFLMRKVLSIYNMIINPVMWIGAFLLANGILFEGRRRQKLIKDKVEIVSIIMLLYFIIYFLSGFIFGFAKNIYSTSFIGILSNIWIYLSVIIFKELTRNKLIKNAGRSNINYVLITILFILCDLQFMSILSNIHSSEIMFKYSFQSIVPLIFMNIISTYLCSISNSIPSILMRGILIVMKIIPPIQPAFDWFMLGMFESCLPVLIYLVTYYFHNKKVIRESKNLVRTKKSNPIFAGFVIIALVFFGFFIGGFFKYQLIAVASGSMTPTFKRGDALIIEKIDKNDYEKLKNGVIIAYRYNDKVVLHRIIEVNEDEQGVTYITKGDNNEYPDNDPVKQNQVIGIIRLKVVYAGYPSVLLGEFFK